MKKFGLIGFPLEHSFSPTFFAEKFYREGIHDCEYQAYPIENVDRIKDLIDQNPELSGLNVTIPYKEQVIPYLDEMDNTSQKIGSVNCIDIRNGRLTGYNTDYLGFLKSIQPLLRPHNRNALVLGSGGSAKTVTYALNQLGIVTTTVSRTSSDNARSYEDLNKVEILKNTIIVNTTPIGMYPEVSNSPDIPYEYLGAQHLLYDLIYNPELTVFLLKGRERKAVTKNGLEMLQIQAEESWAIWNKT